MQEIPFWVVWREDGAAPLKQHASAGAAQSEAKRLSRNNPGVRFFVLEPCYSVVKNDLHETHYGSPF